MLLLLLLLAASSETPPTQVINLQQPISVRKSKKGASFEYNLSGLPLRRSQPMQEGWWLRGVLHCYVTLFW